MSSRLKRLLEEPMPKAPEAPKPIVVSQPMLRRLEIVSLADVKIKPRVWIIPGWLPEGYLTLVSGDGRAGKSSLLYSTIADLSRGDCCLGLNYSPKKAKTLLIGTEDDYSSKIKPFLLARDTDFAFAEYLKATFDTSGNPTSFSLLDVEPLRHEIIKRGTKVVIIDPASSYLPQGLDDNSDVDVRSVLTPLASMAMEERVAIILVKHVGKSTGRRSTGMHLGSAAWRNACRSAWLVIRDDQTERDRVLFDVGSSVGVDQKAIRYEIDGIDSDRRNALRHHPEIEEIDSVDLQETTLSQMYKVEFLGEDDSNPDEMLQRQARATQSESRSSNNCADWLRVRLGKEFAWMMPDIEAEAVNRGFTARQFDSAKKKLRSEGLVSKPRTARGAWYIAFGDPSTMPIGDYPSS